MEITWQKGEFDRLKNYVLERRKYAVEYRNTNFDNIFKRALSDYDAQPVVRGDNDTDLELPEIYIRTEVILAHLLAEFFGYKDTPLSPYGQTNQAHQNTERIGKLWEYRARQMGFLQSMITYFRQAILLGTSVASLVWDVRYDYKIEKKPIYILGMGPFGTNTIRVPAEVYNGPKLTVIDIFGFWVDPDASCCDLQKAHDCGVDRWMTEHELESLVSQEVFSPAVRKVDWSKVNPRYSGSTNDDVPGPDVRKDIQNITPDQPPDVAGGARQVLVTERWGRYTPKGSRLSIPLVVTIVDPGGQEILARPFQKFPYYGNNPFEHGMVPFVGMNYFTRNFCFWGKGLGEVLEGTNAAYQQKVNYRLKNIAIILNKMGIYDPNKIADLNNLTTSRPGGWVPTLPGAGAKDSIYPFDFPDVSQSISYQIHELRQFMDEISGADAIARAAPSVVGAKTPISAMESSLRQKASGQRFKFVANCMMDQGPSKIAEMQLALDRQYIRDTKEFMTLRRGVKGEQPRPEYFEISPEDLAGEYVYFYVGDPLRQNEMLEKNQRLAAIGMLMNPFFMQVAPQGVVQPWVIAKEICKIGDVSWQEALIPSSMVMQTIMSQMIGQAGGQLGGAMQAAMGQMGPPEGVPSGAAGGAQRGGGGGNGKQQRQLPNVPGSTTEPTPALPPVPSTGGQMGAPASMEEGGVMA